MKTKLTILSLCAGLSLLAASLAGASHINHVNNGDFSQGLVGWQIFGAPGDVQVTVDQGAAVITNSYPWSGESFVGLVQCVPIQPGVTYRIEADAFVGLDQSPFGWAQLYAHYYASADCSSGPLGGGSDLVGWDVFTRGDWYHISFDLPAPPNASAIFVRPHLHKESESEGSTGDVTVRYDNISVTAVGQDGQTPPADDPTPPADPTQDPGDPPADPTQDPPADPTQEPPADPTQEPPADPTQDPPADPTQEPPADPTQDPGDPPADPTQDPPDGPVASVTPAVPPKPKFPDFPDGPVDVFVPGPLGGTPEPATTPTPVDDEPQDPPQPERPKTEVPTVQPALDETPAATPTPAPPEATVAVVVADATPLPPSSGTGMSASHGPNLPFFAGLALTLLAVTTAAASAAGERMKRR